MLKLAAMLSVHQPSNQVTYPGNDGVGKIKRNFDCKILTDGDKQMAEMAKEIAKRMEEEMEKRMKEERKQMEKRMEEKRKQMEKRMEEERKEMEKRTEERKQRKR